MERPDVDSIEGLSPSIAIEQKTTTRSPRSTVGTITEIYDYLRVVYSAIGTPHCPNCGKPIARQSTEQIVQSVLALKPDDRMMVLAPVVRGRKGEYKKELEKYAKEGYVRARIDGDLVNLDEPLAARSPQKSHHRNCGRSPAAEKRHRAAPRAIRRDRAEAHRRPRHHCPSSAAKSTSIPKSLHARIAAFRCRNSSRAPSASIRPTARARNATASAQNTISILPK